MSFRGRQMTRNLRTGLRVAGVVLLVVGGVFTAIGFIDFFSSFNSINHQVPPEVRAFVEDERFPSKFWMAFVGLPMVAGGAWCIKAGFLGVAARYVADESHTAVAQVSQAAATGWRVGSGHAGFCSQCGVPQQQGARFCHQCGSPTANRNAEST